MAFIELRDLLSGKAIYGPEEDLDGQDSDRNPEPMPGKGKKACGPRKQKKGKSTQGQADKWKVLITDDVPPSGDPISASEPETALTSDSGPYSLANSSDMSIGSFSSDG